MITGTKENEQKDKDDIFHNSRARILEISTWREPNPTKLEMQNHSHLNKSKLSKVNELC